MLEREPCEEWIERVSAYADGELRDAEQTELMAHVQSCPACREWMEQVRADRSGFVQTLWNQRRRRGFARGVMKQVTAQPAHGSPPPALPWWQRFRLVEMGVSVAMLCVFAFVLFPHFGTSREKARQTGCLSNIKQISLAMLMYQHSLGAPTRNYGLADRLRIAYEAEEDIEVDDVPTAVVQAEHEIATRDGFLLSSDLSKARGRIEAQIVFRVPAEALLETMNALAKLGAVVNRHIAGEDLTEKYVAAERAVESEAQEQERLQKIHRGADKAKDKITVEERISSSHAAAEKQRGEMRRVLARTVLATGTARFLEPEKVARATLLASAERAWRSAGRTGRAFAIVALWLVAYLPFWGGGLALFLLGRRLWRRR